jgi:hypothetical protein
MTPFPQLNVFCTYLVLMHLVCRVLLANKDVFFALRVPTLLGMQSQPIQRNSSLFPARIKLCGADCVLVIQSRAPRRTEVTADGVGT